MNLIIVESPTKARTLSRFLKGKFTVEASVGHIRDLPKSELGVDIENDFDPKYIIPQDKRKRVSELKEIASKSDEIILATDPDREGEAIAWHIAAILKDHQSHKKSKDKGKKKTSVVEQPVTFKRIVFHEITESAIIEAMKEPRTIDMKLVNAQQARRVLDRLVGYKLSPLLWQKLSRRWLSAGRVQSVAVRLIVEREREIERFTKEAYWTITGVFHPAANGDREVRGEFVSIDSKPLAETITLELFDGKYQTTKTSITSKEMADRLMAEAKEPWTVHSVDTKEIRRTPPAPHTTSTLQQEAGRKLYFSSKKTMQTAQRLYEEGFITYHRTDSVNLAEKFLIEAREYIRAQYGPEYLPQIPRKFTTRSKVAQEAHEAIRPTDVRVLPEQIAEHGEMNREHVRLYEMIWKRALASQAKEAVFDATTVGIQSANAYLFEAKGSVVRFDGFLRITGRDAEDVIIPRLSVGEVMKLLHALPEEHTTTPPPRYTEASLVKTLEEKDIGRPSTYAPIISTIMDRQYVVKEDKKLMPTELGKNVNDFLVQYFPDIMSLPFTAGMEDKLDKVANGEASWVPTIREFYKPFEKDLQNSYDLAEKVKVAEEKLDENCPDCGNQLVLKMGRFGKFVACSNFPACKYTRQFHEKINIKCPRCGGEMVVKKTKRGKTFYGCGNYPTCTFAAWKKEDIK